MNATEAGMKAGREDAELDDDDPEPRLYSIRSEFSAAIDEGHCTEADRVEFGTAFIHSYRVTHEGLRRARVAGRAHAKWLLDVSSPVEGETPTMRRVDIVRILTEAFVTKPTDAECSAFEEAFESRYPALVEMMRVT